MTEDMQFFVDLWMKATLPCAKIDTTGWIHSIKTGIKTERQRHPGL